VTLLCKVFCCDDRAPLYLADGGRTWWAHFEFTRINIELTILPKKIEERLDIPN
jgi:hypothetical protein